jgi:hypothetical protein
VEKVTAKEQEISSVSCVRMIMRSGSHICLRRNGWTTLKACSKPYSPRDLQKKRIETMRRIRLWRMVEFDNDTFYVEFTEIVAMVRGGECLENAEKAWLFG